MEQRQNKNLTRAKHTVVVWSALLDYRAEVLADLSSRYGRTISVLHGERLGPTSISADVDACLRRIKLKTRSSLAGLVIVEEIFRHLLRLRPDSVIVEPNPRFLSSVPTLIFCRLLGIPTAVWGLGTVPARLRGWKRIRRVAGTALVAVQTRLARGAIGYGNRAAAIYTRLGGKDKIVVVAPNCRRPLPIMPRLSGDEPRFLYVGKLVAKKRVDLLLRAWQQFSALQDNGRLTIVGDGIDFDQLQQLAECAGILRVTFTGRIKHLDLPTLFAQHDWYVMPGEGGLGATDALASGLPVIGVRGASGDGTFEDFLVESKNCILADAATPESFAGALVRASQMRDHKAMSRAATESVRLRYDNMLAAVEDSLRSIESRFM